ncbi:MAG: sulfotransferase family 2 domain-containing protein [Gammaproteobacteria bacterium]|nr:sulfotransferase family 2 domain-containing protein [Gammaproteobacteria bacterium]
MNKKNLILHCHIFKNAGSTLDWALQRNYGENFCDHREDALMQKQGAGYLNEYIKNNPSFTVISSHHMPFTPNKISKSWWLILLREPIRRVKSVFEFEEKQPISSLGSKMAKELNFSDYIIWRMRDDVPSIIKNHHVRYLNNINNPARIIDDNFVESALSHLNLDNVLTGTVERFDESMVVFEHILKTNFPKLDLAYVPQNTSKQPTCPPHAFLDKLSNEAKTALLSNNRLDSQLYHKADKKLSTSTREIPEFEKKLKEFKNRCQLLLNT